MKIAIIDLYDGESNMGIPAIKNIILAEKHDYQVFDTRVKGDWPKIEEWDAFISSGGPGNPADKTEWSEKWKWFMQSILDHNHIAPNPKPVFLICLSFQLFCHLFELGQVSERTKPSFGPYRCHLTPFGEKETIFGQLPSIFQVADFRAYQITNPNIKNMDRLGAAILALEKKRPHVLMERALMAVKFTQHIYGTQFHPEVHGKSIKEEFFTQKEKYQKSLGQKRYKKILQKLADISSLDHTYVTLLPQFLKQIEKPILK